MPYATEFTIGPEVGYRMGKRGGVGFRMQQGSESMGQGVSGEGRVWDGS